MDRAAVVKMLGERNLLPAIFFIFSRVGCDQAVRQVLRAGVRLTDGARTRRDPAIVEERCRTLLDEDLAVLGYWEWLDGLERGVAAHHAGLLPAFKEVVEELFQKKLVQGRLRDRDPGPRHQHAGPHRRAREAREVQRRGQSADHAGGVHPADRPRRASRHRRRGPLRHPVAGRASTRRRSPPSPPGAPTRSIRASPTYNMAVNLIEQFGRERTREILESRSRSSRPTAPSSTWPARCAARRSRSRATRRRCAATSAISASTPASGVN